MTLKFTSKLFFPLALLLGGSIFLNASYAQEVAPYAFADIPPTNVLKLLEKQERFLIKRIQKSPQSGLDQVQLASTYAAISSQTGDLGYMDKAETLAKKSLVNLPFYNTGAKIVLAEVAESRHQFSLAITAAQEILKTDKTNVGALNTVVTACLGNGRLAEAGEYANQLVKVSPEMSSFTLRALTHLGQGRNDEAMLDFKKALSIEWPNQRLQSAWLRSLIARTHFRSGDIDLADRYTESALFVMPDYHVALAQKAEIYAQRLNNVEAIKYYQQAFNEREEPPYLLAIANIKEAEGKLTEAEILRLKAEKLVRKEIENTPYGHFNELAQILIDRRDPSEREEAIVAAQKNVEQRNNSESHFVLAQAYFNAGRKDEARSSLAVAVASGERNTEYTKFLEDLNRVL